MLVKGLHELFVEFLREVLGVAELFSLEFIFVEGEFHGLALQWWVHNILIPTLLFPCFRLLELPELEIAVEQIYSVLHRGAVTAANTTPEIILLLVSSARPTTLGPIGASIIIIIILSELLINSKEITI